MKRTVLGVPLLALALIASTCPAETVSQRWGAAAARCTHPGALKIVGVAPPRIVFDLSAIPRRATVHRASLRCATRKGLQPTDPIRIHVVGKLAGGKSPTRHSRFGDVAAVHAGAALKLEAPWYRSFDATEAVRKWVANPSSNLGLAVERFGDFDGPRTALDVVYTGQAGKVPPQVAGVRAVHHDGQTFIVWTEHPAYRPKPDEVVWVKQWSEKGDELAAGAGAGAYGQPNHPAITMRALRRLQGLGLRDKPSGFQGIKPLKRVRQVEPVTYRIRRSDKPITADNIAQAQRLAEVEPLSGLDQGVFKIHFKGEYLDQREEPSSPIPTYRIDGRQGIQPGQGLYVHTPAKASKAYYAVTCVLAGTENLRDVGAGNTTGQRLTETPAPPVPVLQFVQRDYYKPDVPEYWHVIWSAPPYFNLPNQPFHVAAAVPKALKTPAPMHVKTPHHGGFNRRGDITVPSSTAVTLQIDQHVPWGSDLCFSEGRGTLRAFTGCRIDFFSERYMSHVIEWAIRKYRVDRGRIGGTLFYFGLRHPEIFPQLFPGHYTVSYDFRWTPERSSLPGLVGPQGKTKTVEGDDAWSVFSLAHFLNKNPARDIPFLFCFSDTGKDSGHTSEFGWQDDPRGWRALLDARQPFIASWSLQDGRMPAETARKFRNFDWNGTVPAFSNCSLDDNPGNGDPADGDYYGQINGYLLWDDKDQADRKDRWEVVVWLVGECPEDACTVDVTPRHCKAFKPKPGAKFTWIVTPAGAENPAGAGSVVADKWGLVTLKQVPVTKAKTRVVITPAK